MENPNPQPKKTKRPKIVQVFTSDGRIAAVQYDNGRVFIWNREHAPNPFEESGAQGYWADIGYSKTKVENQKTD